MSEQSLWGNLRLLSLLFWSFFFFVISRAFQELYIPNSRQDNMEVKRPQLRSRCELNLPPLGLSFDGVLRVWQHGSLCSWSECLGGH